MPTHPFSPEATAAARPSAPIRQSVDRNAEDRDRSPSSNPPTASLGPHNKRCRATERPDLCLPSRHKERQSCTQSHVQPCDLLAALQCLCLGLPSSPRNEVLVPWQR